MSLEQINQRCKTWNKDVSLRAAQHIFNQVRQHYNQHIKTREALVIERKHDSRSIDYQVVPDTAYTILSEEFKNHFNSDEKTEEVNLRKREQNLDDDTSDVKKAFVFA